MKHSSKGNSCRQMTLTKQKLLLEILYTLYVATSHESRIPRKAKRFFRWRIFFFEYPRRRSGKGNVYFANYRFSFRKLQISISQTTDFHFANYRFPFRFVPFRFANYSKPFETTSSCIYYRSFHQLQLFKGIAVPFPSSLRSSPDFL